MTNYIAIIDNGVINQHNNKLFKSLYVTDEYKMVDDELKEISFKHGSVCSFIISKYVDDVRIISIRILDENGKGDIDKLYVALNWCFENNIRLINLSFGTTHFLYKSKVREIINFFSNKNMILVCAGANDGFTSYPSKFSNTIGVATGDIDLNYDFNIHTGVEFIANSEHSLSLGEFNATTSRSNSYAVPYVVSKVYNILQNDYTYNLTEIKNKLAGEVINNNIHPDWINTAFFVGTPKFTQAKTYFKVINEDYNANKDKIDTIVYFENLEKPQDDIKNIVAFFDIKINSTGRMSWTPNLVYKQLQNYVGFEKKDIVPIIAIDVDENTDEFYLVQSLFNSFFSECYNALTISTTPQCVLYDINYLPLENEFIEKEFIKENLIDKVKCFIESEVFYCQSDVVILSGLNISDKLEMLDGTIKPSISIKISSEISSINKSIHICDDEGFSKKIDNTKINEISIEMLFTQIKMLLSKGNV